MASRKTVTIGCNKKIKQRIKKIVSSKDSQFRDMTEFVDHHLRIAISKMERKAKVQS